jgi:hypothetical protein
MMFKLCSKFAVLVFVVLAVPRVWAQGPPYQTDDPVPVPTGHYEFYIFGGVAGTADEIDPTGPAVEFNWGAVPNIQLHVILPLGAVVPRNNPASLPGGTGPSVYGLTDMETGIKWAWIKESKYMPQIGTFTMFELPTGSYSKGLGVGKLWYKVPLWAQKNIGPWTLDGGGGITVVPQSGFRNYPFGGFLVKREIIHNRLELGAEVFSHGAEDYGTPPTRGSTMIGVGGYYHFKNPDHQFLFAYDHSVAGRTEDYAYIGIYWTWGKDRRW